MASFGTSFISESSFHTHTFLFHGFDNKQYTGHISHVILEIDTCSCVFQFNLKFLRRSFSTFKCIIVSDMFGLTFVILFYFLNVLCFFLCPTNFYSLLSNSFSLIIWKTQILFSFVLSLIFFQFAYTKIPNIY